MRYFSRLRTASIRCILSILITISSGFAFGQNKVQYTDFSWHYYPASHFTLYFHQGQGDLPATTYRMMGDIYRTLSRRFQFTHKDPVPVIVYGDPNFFTQTNVIMEMLPEEVGGFTEMFKSRVVVPFDGSFDEFNHVVHHEMVHAFVYGILYDQMGSSLLSGNLLQMPLWFMEGLAEYLSSGWNIEADMFLMDYTINAEVPPPGPALDGYMAYKGGQSFLLFLASSHGDSLFTRFLREFKTSKSLEKSVKSVYKKDIEALGKEWLRELKRLYWPEIGRRIYPEKNATAITSHIESRSFLNLRPRISPDGKRIAFFSDRRDFTRILITDRKGKIEQEISQSGYSGHFESFHPFRSGMCWSPDGKKLIFVTAADGHDQLRIVDVTKRKLVKTITTHLSSIAGPDWSHDGNSIAFAGVDSGRCDLFLYNLKNDELRRLTNDAACESDPRFSPGDSSLIYSVQDTCLKVGDPPMTAWGITPNNLAMLNLGTGVTRVLARTPWNDKQPCFSSRGDRVLFVSDRNGIDNLYIAPLDSIEKGRPITDYIGGCSHPDWSLDGSSVVFTLFQKQGWDIWLMEKPLEKFVADSLEKTKWVEAMLDTSRHYFAPAPVKTDSVRTEKIARQEKKTAARDTLSPMTLPATVKKNDTVSPAVSMPSETPKHDTVISLSPVAEVKSSSSAGTVKTPTPLPPEVSTDTVTPKKKNEPPATAVIPAAQPYRLKFSPDLVTVGLGMSSFYGYAGQWLLSLSDIMGDHHITLAGDIQNDFESTMHFFGSYMYLKKRINFGGGLYYFKDFTGYNDSLYYYDAELGAFFEASYPFSMFSRLDFELLARTINRMPQGDSTAVANSSGNYTVNIIMPSFSYSFDNILWGMTGPLNGMRAEGSVEVLPPFSFIKDPFVSCEIDVRHYLHLWKRFVWANRIFIGASQSPSAPESPRRYLLGGNENWLFTYSDINYEQYAKNVRYEFYSDMVVPFRGWRYFDLSGSRCAVFNTEFRFPFIREFSTVFPLPLAIRYINGAVFADIGNAWDRSDQINGFPLPRKVYAGIGFGCRVDLGMFLLRYDRGWPLDMGEVFHNSSNPFPAPPINYFSLGAEF
ncbi:MAG: BamA/TamA family outer membrane protein [Chitinispirillaceae bacterium]|jgi:WD40 repeat protein